MDIKQKNKVIIRNIPVTVDDDLVDLIFTSSKYGNADIISIENEIEKDGSLKHVILEYDSEASVQKVVQIGMTEIEGVKFIPEVYIITKQNEPDTPTNGVFIENVNKNEVEALLLLFENTKKTAGSVITNSEYNECNKILKIFYENDVIAQKVANFGCVTFNKKQYQAYLIKNNDHQNAIMLENIDERQVDYLLLVYENKSKSGGDSIDRHEYDAKHKTLVIFYENEETAKRVVQFGPVTFQQQTYRAKQFKRQLSDNNFKAAHEYETAKNGVIIENVENDQVESMLLLYENTSKSGGGAIRTHVYNPHTNELEIDFEEYETKQNVLKFGKIKFLNRIYLAKDAEIKEKIETQTHEWVLDANMLTAIKENLQNHPEFRLKIEKINEKHAKLQIEGVKAAVQTQIIQINSIIRELNAKKTLKKFTNLTDAHLKLLNKMDFFGGFKENLKIDVKFGELSVEGNEKCVQQFEAEFNRNLARIQSKSFKIDFYVSEYLQKSQLYLIETIEKELNVQLECKIFIKNINNIELVLYTAAVQLQTISIDDLFTRIQSGIAYFEYKISTDLFDATLNMYEKFLKQIQAELEMSHEDDRIIFYLNRTEKCVRCVGDVFVVKNITEKIKDFFDSNTQFTFRLNNDTLSKVDLKFLKLIVKESELNGICLGLVKKQQNNGLLIDLKFLNSNVNCDTDLVLELRTTKKLYEKFLVEVNQLLNGSSRLSEVFFVDCLNKEAVAAMKNFSSSVYAIEKSCECLVVLLDDALRPSSDMSNTNNGQPPSPTNSIAMSAPEIQLEIGSILDSKYNVDVIVNTTSSDLTLTNGTVSKQLLEKAGNQIQNELRQNYPNGLNSQQHLIAISTSGNLKHLKYIFHVSLPSWNPTDEPKIERLFKSTLNELLTSVDLKMCCSIAIPAIGTGILNYPKDKVPKWMYEAISGYLNSNKGITRITRVLIVLYDKDVDTIKYFKNYESKPNTKPVQVKPVPVQQTSSATNQCPFYTNLTGDFKSGYKMSFGKVTVHVLIGDIVKCQTDVIVNPTNKDLNMSGSVSKVLLDAAGGSFIPELTQITDGILWTTNGNLKCKQLVHVDVTSGASICETVLNVIIALNDTKQYKSILFPVIGTGTLSYNASDVANKMLLAFSLFIYNCEAAGNIGINFNEIVVCVYEKQAHILDVFHAEMNYLLMKQAYVKADETAIQCQTFNRVRSFMDTVNGDGKAQYNADQNSVPQNSLNSNGVHDQEKLKFQLISDKKEKIENAKQQLNDLIKHEFTQLSVYSDYINTLSPKNLTDIQKICEQLNCKFRIHTKELKLQGASVNLSICVNKIHEYINNFMIYRINNAQVLANNIQWSYALSGDGTWTAYNIFLNERIENAYQSKQQDIVFDDDNGELCCIKFDRLVEVNNGTGSVRFKVKRDDLTNMQVKIKMPDYWCVNKKNDLIMLDKTSNEYKQVLSSIGNMGGKLNKIISIQRIQNFRLYLQYMTHKLYFNEKNNNNSNERVLFHGTTEDSVESICKFGFNRSYAGKNATMYGKGVYFASTTVYSHDFTNLNLKMYKLLPNRNQLCGHIFVTKVLVGNIAVGNQNTESRNLPKLADNFTPVDTTVNNLQTPTIFVIYHDAQAYPEYLITYQ